MAILRGGHGGRLRGSDRLAAERRRSSRHPQPRLGERRGRVGVFDAHAAFGGFDRDPLAGRVEELDEAEWGRFVLLDLASFYAPFFSWGKPRTFRSRFGIRSYPLRISPCRV